MSFKYENSIDYNREFIITLNFNTVVSDLIDRTAAAYQCYFRKNVFTYLWKYRVIITLISKLI